MMERAAVTRSGSGFSIATNSFKHKDVLRLQFFLKEKYNLTTGVNKCGVKNQYVLYFHANTMPKLARLVKYHFVESIKYKLGKYCSSAVQEALQEAVQETVQEEDLP